MISRDLLGRAHAALSVSPNGGPCTGVLREILSSIEGDVPPPEAAGAAVVSTMGDPTLVYVSSSGVVDLGGAVGLNLPVVHLRFIQALLDHASQLVDTALNVE
jgi:hypothetical protein